MLNVEITQTTQSLHFQKPLYCGAYMDALFPQGICVSDFETLLYIFCDDGLHETSVHIRVCRASTAFSENRHQ